MGFGGLKSGFSGVEKCLSRFVIGSESNVVVSLGEVYWGLAVSEDFLRKE